MKIIAHRGNANGPNPIQENHPDTIMKAFSMGFDAEVDIRYVRSDNKFYLGHDNPQYDIDWNWLSAHKKNLWIHCKNIEALYEFVCGTKGFHYFWHQSDDFTLTSKNYIWTYPGQPFTRKSIIVMPETYLKEKDFDNLFTCDCYGVCTDYPQRLLK